MEKSAEILAQEGHLTTEQLTSCLQLVSQCLGGNASNKVGFLGLWWGMFWDVFVVKCSSGAPPGSVTMSSLLSQMAGRPSPVMPIASPSPSPTLDPNEAHRQRLAAALSSVGLAGRDPSTLTPTEKAAVNSALQQMGSPVIKSLAPAVSHLSIQQQLAQYQQLVLQQHQQQQIMFQQYQQLMMQMQMMASGRTSKPLIPMPGPPQPPTAMPIQPSRPAPVSTRRLSSPTDQVYDEDEGQYMQQQPPAPTIHQTAMESAAMKSVMMAGQKRPRVFMDSQTKETARQFLNMPDVDDADDTHKMVAVGASLLPLAEYDVHTKRVSSIHITCDSKYVISAGHDRRIVVYDTTSLKMLGELPITHKERITRIRCTRIGKRRLLASSSFDRTVQLWDFGQCNEELGTLPTEPFQKFTDHPALITSLDFASEADPETDVADLVATCDSEGNVVIRSIKQNKIIYSRPSTKSATIRMATFVSDRDHFLAMAIDERVEILDWRADKIVYTIVPANKKPVLGISWDRGVLAVVTAEEVFVWSVDFGLHLPLAESFTGKCVATYKVQADKINAIQVTRDGSLPPETFLKARQDRIIVIGGYQKIIVWRIQFDRTPGSKAEIDTRQVSYSVPAHTDLVAALFSGGLNERDPFVVSGGFDHKVIIWKLKHNQPNVVVETPDVSIPTTSSVDDLATPVDFDPVSMFLNTDDLSE